MSAERLLFGVALGPRQKEPNPRILLCILVRSMHATQNVSGKKSTMVRNFMKNIHACTGGYVVIKRAALQ